MFQVFDFPQTDNVEVEENCKILFEEAVLHPSSVTLRSGLNVRFSNLWIRRDRPILWPQKSAPFTTGFFLFGDL